MYWPSDSNFLAQLIRLITNNVRTWDNYLFVVVNNHVRNVIEIRFIDDCFAEFYTKTTFLQNAFSVTFMIIIFFLIPYTNSKFQIYSRGCSP